MNSPLRPFHPDGLDRPAQHLRNARENPAVRALMLLLEEQLQERRRLALEESAQVSPGVAAHRAGAADALGEFHATVCRVVAGETDWGTKE